MRLPKWERQFENNYKTAIKLKTSLSPRLRNNERLDFEFDILGIEKEIRVLDEVMTELEVKKEPLGIIGIGSGQCIECKEHDMHGYRLNRTLGRDLRRSANEDSVLINIICVDCMMDKLVEIELLSPKVDN